MTKEFKSRFAAEWIICRDVWKSLWAFSIEKIKKNEYRRWRSEIFSKASKGIDIITHTIVVNLCLFNMLYNMFYIRKWIWDVQTLRWAGRALTVSIKKNLCQKACESYYCKTAFTTLVTITVLVIIILAILFTFVLD